MSSPSAAMMNAVSQARLYAVNSQYDTAITFYEGLDGEIARYTANIRGDEALKGQYEEFRIQLADEKAICQELQAELKAMVNPAEGVRRDRGIAPPARDDAMYTGERAHGNMVAPSGGGSSSPRKPAPRAQSRDVGHSNPYQPPRPDYGGGGGYDHDPGMGMGMGMGMGGGGIPGAGLDFGIPSGQPPAHSVGGKNEAAWGDRDRFGPPKEPKRVNSGAGGGWNNNYKNNNNGGGMPNNRLGGSPGGGGGNYNNAPPPPVSKDRAKEKNKPPLPKFGGGGGNQQRGGPSGGGRQGGGAGGRNGANPNQPGGGKVGRYQPRPGDEDLAQMIEADMSTGENSNVGWDDVAGHAEAKGLLEEAVVYPVMMPEYYQGIRRPWRGVLMYGPPGTGKTMLAKAVASECGTTFFNISPATLTSKWRGDSEKMVRILFEMARHYAPSTIFIDEIDSLCSQRGGDGEHEASRRAKSVLLTQMDGVGVDTSKIVMVLGATNHPWDIDEAMRRRLEQRIYIPLPAEADIVEIMKINCKSIKLGDDVDFEELAHIAARNNYSAADLTNAVRAASMSTMRKYMEAERANKNEIKKKAHEVARQVAEIPVSRDAFIEAIQNTPSSINLDQIRRFEKWQQEFATT